MSRSIPFRDLPTETIALAGDSPAAVAIAVRHSDGTWEAAGHPAGAENRRYEIGSVTKAVTGVLLGVLARAGEVDPHSPIDDALGQALPWRDAPGSPPHLVDAATHHTGLPNTLPRLQWREAAVAWGLSRRDPWRDIDATTFAAQREECIRRARPRRTFSYSSLGVGLLGDALAAATGSGSYERLVRERLLAPLGMDRTGIDRPADPAGRVEVGSNRRGRPMPYLRDHMPAAGMLASDLADLRRLVDAALGDGPEDVVRGIDAALRSRAELSSGFEIGYCWFLDRRGEHAIAHHDGGTWGSQAHLSLCPDTGRAVIALSATYRPLAPFADRVHRALR
ncbi:serine hydrolase domain-containing protein [Microbacterium sp. TNHR37B]|uniref:serine hydrolase domain-containing protein n=1 Tax=Microbacterium sp. TNHR37B TaxID=1775956 RepID=UPI0007B2C9FF|nr:serine hydrolase domain-containing protein [Microbacterium sp. TNHR37B]KZE90746.1 D-alanyl-D-alanine-carboxypeptidase/endopeptidase AmpH [Microbacterium sp. TNHR37B]